jgi:hypothetical protein
MTTQNGLYKTTITIWSDFDPSEYNLQDLGFQADEGDAYCSNTTTEIVENPADDPQWDGTEFFDVPDHRDELFTDPQ